MTNVAKQVADDLCGKTGFVEKNLAAESVIDTPVVGRHTGGHAPKGLARLQEEMAETFSRVDVINVLDPLDCFYFAIELIAHFPSPQNGYTSLPLAVMGRAQADRIQRLFMYHSLWAWEGRHRIRDPLFGADETIGVPDDIKAYHEALDSGDTGRALGVFTPEASAREPSGDEYGDTCDKPLNAFFDGAFKDGGVHLTYHTLIEDGDEVAAEYTCHGWGGVSIPPQAGMELWTRAPGSRRLASVRIYDDVSQPGL